MSMAPTTDAVAFLISEITLGLAGNPSGSHGLGDAPLVGPFAQILIGSEESIASLLEFCGWGMMSWLFACAAGIVALAGSLFARRRRHWYAVMGTLALVASGPGILGLYAVYSVFVGWELSWQMPIRVLFMVAPVLFGIISLVRWKRLPKTAPPAAPNQRETSLADIPNSKPSL